MGGGITYQPSRERYLIGSQSQEPRALGAQVHHHTNRHDMPITSAVRSLSTFFLPDSAITRHIFHSLRHKSPLSATAQIQPGNRVVGRPDRAAEHPCPSDGAVSITLGRRRRRGAGRGRRSRRRRFPPGKHPPGAGGFTWQIPAATDAHAGVTLAVPVGRDARGGRARAWRGGGRFTVRRVSRFWARIVRRKQKYYGSRSHRVLGEKDFGIAYDGLTRQHGAT